MPISIITFNLAKSNQIPQDRSKFDHPSLALLCDLDPRMHQFHLNASSYNFTHECGEVGWDSPLYLSGKYLIIEILFR